MRSKIGGIASKASSATINETPLSQADPFVKMSVTAILSGMASKASGGDFVQGVLSAMVVWLYNDWWSDLKNKARGYYTSTKAFARKYGSRIIGGVGGVLQVGAGVGVIIGTEGVGTSVGWLMIAHGLNNIQEAWTGKNDGYLRKTYHYVLGKYTNYAYATFDIGLSGMNLLRIANEIRSVRYFQQGFGEVESARYLRGFETMNKYELFFEGVNNINTVYSNIGDNK